ncbi:hypothetical protein GOP47_0022177, partial [Adiantum capillus-veneris]
HLEECSELKRVDLSAGFLSLTSLIIRGCESVKEVKLGLQALPNLSELVVSDCSEACVLSGVEGLKLLDHLNVDCYSMLQQSRPKCLSSLTRLRDLTLSQKATAWKQQRVWDYKSAGLEELRSLVRLTISSAGRSTAAPINLAELTNLGTLIMQGMVSFEGLDNLKRLERLHELGSSDDSLECASDEDDETVQKCPPCLAEARLLSIFPQNLTELRMICLKHLRRLDGIDRLIHLFCLHLEACPMLELELPSLHALQEMELLWIRECVTLKGVRGCDEMRKLEWVQFQGCDSMEELPFKDIHALPCRLTCLSFEGCRFARDRELLLEWADLCGPLCVAALRQFLWEYYSQEVRRRDG